MQLRIIFIARETKETVRNCAHHCPVTKRFLRVQIYQTVQTENSDCSRKITSIFLPSLQDIIQNTDITTSELYYDCIVIFVYVLGKRPKALNNLEYSIKM